MGFSESSSDLDLKIAYFIENFGLNNGLNKVIASVNNYLEYKTGEAFQAKDNNLERWHNACGICRMLEAEIEPIIM